MSNLIFGVEVNIFERSASGSLHRMFFSPCDTWEGSSTHGLCMKRTDGHMSVLYFADNSVMCAYLSVFDSQTMLFSVPGSIGTVDSVVSSEDVPGPLRSVTSVRI
jgi:hypothetical protein